MHFFGVLVIGFEYTGWARSLDCSIEKVLGLMNIFEQLKE